MVAGTTIEARIFPTKQGLTRISIPPLGEIRAKTHKAPVGLEVSVDRISVGQVRRLADPDFSQEELLKQAENDLIAAGRQFAASLLFLAALGGLAAGLMLPGRSFKRALAATLVGLVAVAAPGFFAIKSYDVKAWSQPKYTGMLATAPWIMGTLEEKINDFDAFRAELRGLARNLHDFYAKIDGWEPVKLGDDKLKVLHVGDIHNNPAAFDLIAQVVRDFHVDMIIDTGDLTDLGTPMEASLGSRVGSLGVPYVFVPGNHDSESVVTSLRAQANVIIADENMVEVEGLKIFGAADPASHQFDARPTIGPRLGEFSREVLARYKALTSEPDVVAIHSIAYAGPLVGRAPLILTGHTHRPSLKKVKGTLIDDVGTTGAAGLRTFQVKEGVPYSLKLLYFAKKPKKVIAVDSLAFSGASRDFMLERHLIAEDAERLKNPVSSGSLNLSWRTN